MHNLLLECACYLARAHKGLPGHWRLARWLNQQQRWLRQLPARNRSLGRGARLFVNLGDYDGLRYLIHGITVGDPLTALLQRVLRPGDVFVDVGANVGMYSVVASLRVGPTGRVMALEASPTTFERLQVIARHDPGNISVLHCAASDAPGNLEFFIGPADHSGVSSLRDLGDATTQRVAVPADTLDRLLSTLPKTRFIKIDVEGAELAVIRGAIGTIARDRPFLAMELTPRFLVSFGHSLDQLLGLVVNLGYKCRRLNPLLDEFSGLIGDEFQCDVVFIPAEEDQAFMVPT